MSRLTSFLLLAFVCLTFTSGSYAKQNYKVISHLIDSFLEFDDNTETYNGFVVDLIDELNKKLHFTYEIVLPPDNKYGSYNPSTKKWNGMMGYLLDGQGDMIIADLTDTIKRREVADVTTPFLSTGLGIMYHQVTRQALPFSNLDELADQTEVNYGTVNHGSTYEFIKRGKNETFVKMANYFEQHPEFLVNSVLEGVEKVMTSNGKFAFIGEGVAYYVLKKQRYPELILVGETFFPRHFGIVFPKGSKNKAKFESALTELREAGVLDELAKKWSLN
uniref:CSON009149 protein n=1 Tax=Culicoides sonorensis TaxID=179676 RepID=A0A336LNS6_CULSO